MLEGNRAVDAVGAFIKQVTADRNVLAHGAA
jgi:hypothetical protein